VLTSRFFEKAALWNRATLKNLAQRAETPTWYTLAMCGYSQCIRSTGVNNVGGSVSRAMTVERGFGMCG